MKIVINRYINRYINIKLGMKSFYTLLFPECFNTKYEFSTEHIFSHSALKQVTKKKLRENNHYFVNIVRNY